MYDPRVVHTIKNMKFVDEAQIFVQGGKGGDGCLSFRREKFIALGGPNGGDGGDGGSIFLQADNNLNTLVDFRYKKEFVGENGKPGGGSECTGRSGKDIVIKVPVGTLVYDVDHENLLVIDLNTNGQKFCVAQGGFHGLGNRRFKSSINRTPRQITKGKPGDERNLLLELQLLADIGLVGQPNVGKSTLLAVVSAARPKIADYAFTTLEPNLGVVRVGEGSSFVMADIPGLIAGASQGVGLGLQFLRHIKRTRVLCHLVNLQQDVEQIVKEFREIEHELGEFDPELLEKPRWLVFNQIDIFAEPEEAEAKAKQVLEILNWQGPYRLISAKAKRGTEELCQELSRELKAHAMVELELDPEE